MKKIILMLLLVLFLVPNGAYAYKKTKVNALIKEIGVDNDNRQIIYLKTEGDSELKNIAYLPEKAMIKAEVCLVQKEKRWHKHAYALLRLIEFVPDESDESVNLYDDNLYLVARRYIPVDFPDAAGTGIELGATTAASFFFPGIDIAYYFAKGAIKRDNNPNWFKSGVSEAYDNSIFWFIQKGRTIKLEEEAEVQLKTISSRKVNKLLKQKD